MNALSFNPTASYIGSKDAGLSLQGKQLALQQAQTNAPKVNALADISLRGAQQAEQAGVRNTGISEESSRVQFLSQFGQAMEKIPTVEGRVKASQMLVPLAQKVGVDPSVFTPENLSDQSVQQLIATTRGFIDNPADLDRAKLAIRQRELEQRNELMRLKPQIAGDTEKYKVLGQREGDKAGLEQDISAGKERGKGVEKRLQLYIDDGITAAETLPTINRTLELLDQVKTGGYASVALAAKQKFGIEGADEGELSANLGKAILAQMRATFGAAFTEREGDKLDRIEANFGKSAATNKRLLGNLKSILEREARRGIDAAGQSGDDFSVNEINNLLKFKVGKQEEGPKEVTTQAEFDALPAGTVYMEDGQQYRKP